MNIFILGAGVMQIPVINKAKKMGHFVLCADGNSEAIGKSLPDIFYPIDLKDKVGLLNIAEKFHKKHTLHGVFTAGTDFSSSVAWITNKLNLPGITYEAAMNATDKIRMRAKFNEYNVPSPKYVEYSADMNINNIMGEMQFPVVIKPVDSMGGRGVCKVSNIEELVKASDLAISHSKTSRAIVEEYIDGPEFSLDALVIDGKVEVFGFADREIMFPPSFVEMGHTIPTNISEDMKNEIVTVFSQGVKALGINYGSAKGDMKYSVNGPVIGEIAARLSGGYMSGWTYPYSSDIDLIKGGIELALGQDLTIRKEDRGYYSAERAFISIPGVVKEIFIKEKDKSIKDIFTNCKVGDVVVFPTNNVEKCGNIISVDKKRDTAIKNAEKFAADIIIRLEPNEIATQDFLFSDKNIHRAFDIDNKLYSKLDQSVEIDNGTIYINKVDKILKSRKKDWHNRTINRVLTILKNYYDIQFVEDTNCGKEFYESLINGSIQGVLYYLDTLEI
ncbi:MAG: ATP-grasp domain-containing protein [Spirochaetaceae bacterium]